MKGRLRCSLFVCGFGLGLAGIASQAWAAPKDAAALKLEKDAIYNDYLATKFGDAEAKLQKALAICKGTACSPKVVAQLHRDLAIVYTVGIRKPDEAKKEFSEALKADPEVTLIKDLTTPEIEQAFNAARGSAPGADSTAAAPGGASGAEIVHTPPTEQATLTPVPIYVELPSGLNAVRVQVRYRPFGSPDWKTIDMKKSRDGWGVELPCLDIGTTTGDLKYFVQALDANGDVLATSGTRAAPHLVPIRNELQGEPPHLPDKPPPAQCANQADCPPGLPGCKSERRRKHGNKPAGEMCEDSGECQEGLACRVGQCVTDDTAGAGHACVSSDECDAGQACTDGVCGSNLPPANPWWVNISFQQDFLFTPSSNEVCGESSKTYTCFYGNGTQFDPQVQGLHMSASDPGDTTPGGIAPATSRVLVGLDRLLGNNWTVGARVGFAFNGGPQAKGTTGNPTTKSFMPLHGELRAAYWFGSTPFRKTGFRPFLAAAFGMAEVDGSVSVTTYTTAAAADGADSGPEKVAAWYRRGNLFASIGLGTQYALKVNSAPFIEVKAMQLLGDSATAISTQIGYAHGF